MPLTQANPFVMAIRENEAELREESAVSERLGRLSDRTAALLREMGVMRQLQPKAFGGFETDPQTFLETAFTLASVSGSAGWVGGVVALHPWEVGQMPETVQRDIWGDDPDTWVSSPYAPIGRGSATEGGLVFSGRWPFASGTDHCKWAFLGGVDVEQPKVPLHFLIPKADYEIDHDSWDVIGLKGTGSKDIVVTEKFVRNERIVVADAIAHGNADASWAGVEPLYRMPFWVLFPAAIAAATLGIAQGAVDAYIRAVQGNAARWGRLTQNAAQLSALSVAASDIDASFVQLLDGVNRSFEAVSAGRSVTIMDRMTIRRDQTRAVRRSFDAVMGLYQEAGSLGIRSSNEFSRFFRDLAVGAEHVSNSPELFLRGYGNAVFGQPIPPEVRIGPAPERDALSL